MQYLYVCHFSNGHIKVGRSIAPAARIAAHADRVACIAIELVEHQVFGCESHVGQREMALIKLCNDAAAKRNKSEWFEGLCFLQVCEWAAEISMLPASSFNDDAAKPFKDAAAAVVSHYGTHLKVAEALGYTDLRNVSAWVTGLRPFPATHCVRIERDTNHAVSRQALRPDDYWLIWPDLPAPTAKEVTHG